MLCLHTLGELRLDDAGGATLSRRRKPLVLLAYLCRRAPRPVSRAELAALVWGEREESKARQSLRQALLELKRHLGDALLFEQDSVSIAPGAVELDIIAFEQDADEGRDPSALARWSGAFLAAAEDGAEESLSTWVETERAGLQRRLAIVLERMLQDAERRGNWSEAIAIAKRWSDALPFDERASRRLIGALRLGGQGMAAIAAHAAFITRLRDSLEIEPSREFMELAGSLDETVLTTTAETAGSTSMLPFVGREDSFATLATAWKRTRQGQAQVALVEGGAGHGISRFCAELARWAHESDAHTLVFHADLGRATRAFDGARAIFSELADAPDLAGASPEALSAITGIVPALRGRFPRLAARPAEQADGVVAAALREAMNAVAEESAVLVIADGIASADGESRALLLSLAAAPLSRVMVVFADDSPAIDGEPALAAMRDDAAVVRVTLGSLAPGDIAALLDGDDTLARRLHDDTGGIPALVAGEIESLASERLLVQGVSGASVASPALVGRALPTPASARAMVRELFRSLDEDCRRVLEAMAVFGAPLSTADAARLAHAAPETARRTVDALLRSDRARRVGDSGVELTPPLFARAAYELV
ncbi:MAG: AAA family ATPase, partial [Gemmatimonadota bacterium]|nr:AAA family ATPase [Gemmatimonadota bacterium]